MPVHHICWRNATGERRHQRKGSHLWRGWIFRRRVQQLLPHSRVPICRSISICEDSRLEIFRTVQFQWPRVPRRVRARCELYHRILSRRIHPPAKRNILLHPDICQCNCSSQRQTHISRTAATRVLESITILFKWYKGA